MQADAALRECFFGVYESTPHGNYHQVKAMQTAGFVHARAYGTKKSQACQGGDCAQEPVLAVSQSPNPR